MGRRADYISEAVLRTTPARSPGAGFNLRRAMLVLDGVVLLAAVVFAMMAPHGNWRDSALGIQFDDHADPGQKYVDSSLVLFTSPQETTPVGHPGLTMRLLIWLIAGIGHLPHLVTGGGDSLAAFWANNLRGLFIALTIVMAGCHVLSFHLLLGLCRRLLGDTRVAFLAVLAYATLMPTLFFFTRVSPEPILVSFVLAALLYAWRADDALVAERTNVACLLAGAAGLAAAGAVLTNLHLAYPLIPLGLAMVLAQSRGDGRPVKEVLSERIQPALYFCVCAGAVLYLSTYKIDWRAFLGDWAGLAPATDVGEGIWEVLRANLARFSPLPAAGRTLRDGFFTLAEGLFLACSAVGLGWYLQEHPEKRRIVLWPLLYVALLIPVAAYRGTWHYLVLHLAAAAVFFAFFLRRIIARFMCEGESALLRHGIALVLLIHVPAIAFGISLKVNDVRAYNQERASYSAEP